jgi:ribosome-associated protein
MKVLAKQNDSTPRRITITTDYIKLESFLKLADACPSGGMAKNFIQNGEVTVNGAVCTMRGKKLRDGDCVCFGGTYVVAHEN